MDKQLVFGVDTLESIEKSVQQGARQDYSPNPCVNAYGEGPPDAKCKTCSHLHGLVYSKTYWKCDLRNNTHGTGTDHRVNWPACSKYEQGEPTKHDIQH